MKIAVLISGRGSNLQSLIDACATPTFPAEIALVISNHADAYGLTRAQAAGIPTQCLDHTAYGNREAFDDALSAAIADSGAELVCLAGFMRLLSDKFVARWHDKLINIHPSLLPAFKGLHVQQRAIDAGVRFSGCTVHFVRPAMDAGPIIIQAAVPVHSDDDAGTLAARILEQEHQIYPLAVRWIAEGRIRINDECVVIENTGAPSMAMINPQSA